MRRWPRSRRPVHRPHRPPPIPSARLSRLPRHGSAQLVGGRLESCLFIEPASHSLSGREWLHSLFTADALSSEQRLWLLSGQSPKGGVATGRTVCACHGVGENAILTAIREGQTDVERIGRALKAGTGCGACIPELKGLLGLA